MVVLNSSYSCKGIKQSEKDNFPALSKDPDTMDWTKTSRAGMRTQQLPSAVREKWRSKDKCLHCGSDGHFIKDCPICPYVRKQPAEKKKVSYSTKSAKLKSKQNDENKMLEEDNSEDASETKSLKE